MDTLMIVGIILFIAGFILIAVEMVVPGFGAPGISGIACLVIGLFLTADTIEEGAFITVIVLALLAIMMAIFSMMPLLLRTPRKTPAHIMVEAMVRPEAAWLLMMELCSFLPR